MIDEDQTGGAADDLLRSALLDDSAAVAVSLRVEPLPLSDSVTVIFHGRRDLGTLQTYVTWGSLGAGSRVSAGALLRVPCDLDLADAEDRDEAEALYVAQAQAMRDALIGADTVLGVWREPLAELAGTVVCGRPFAAAVGPSARPPPVADRARLARDPDHRHAGVRGARTLADGRPPMGIARVPSRSFARVYPLADDPERCVEEFLDLAAEHAHGLADRLAHQEASVQRFLELSDPDG